jgi:hypothetical protein
VLGISPGDALGGDARSLRLGRDNFRANVASAVSHSGDFGQGWLRPMRASECRGISCNFPAARLASIYRGRTAPPASSHRRSCTACSLPRAWEASLPLPCPRLFTQRGGALSSKQGFY